MNTSSSPLTAEQALARIAFVNQFGRRAIEPTPRASATPLADRSAAIAREQADVTRGLSLGRYGMGARVYLSSLA